MARYENQTPIFLEPSGFDARFSWHPRSKQQCFARASSSPVTQALKKSNPWPHFVFMAFICRGVNLIANARIQSTSESNLLGDPWLFTQSRPQDNLNALQLLATDILALATMKNAAKCDT
jgi:hypothetical protein